MDTYYLGSDSRRRRWWWWWWCWRMSFYLIATVLPNWNEFIRLFVIIMELISISSMSINLSDWCYHPPHELFWTTHKPSILKIGLSHNHHSLAFIVLLFKCCLTLNINRILINRYCSSMSLSFEHQLIVVDFPLKV